MLKCSLFIVSYLKVRERHGDRCHFWLQQSPRSLLHTRQRKGWPTAVWVKSLSPGLNRMAWKLYYNTNNYKMHIYRQENFNSHPYQNNFKRYFLESKATNQIHHNLIMHKQTAQHSSASRSPPSHFVFPFHFVCLSVPLCCPTSLHIVPPQPFWPVSLCPSLSVLQVTTIESVICPSSPLCPASGG